MLYAGPPSRGMGGWSGHRQEHNGTTACLMHMVLGPIVCQRHSRKRHATRPKPPSERIRGRRPSLKYIVTHMSLYCDICACERAKLRKFKVWGIPLKISARESGITLKRNAKQWGMA